MGSLLEKLRKQQAEKKVTKEEPKKEEPKKEEPKKEKSLKQTQEEKGAKGVNPEPEKKKRGRPSKMDELKKKTKSNFARPDFSKSKIDSKQNGQRITVMLNAMVVKADESAPKATHLIDLLRPLMQQVADENEKAHYALIPYGEGKAMLAHAFDKWLTDSGWSGIILVDGMTPESQVVREVLIARADTVVRGHA